MLKKVGTKLNTPSYDQAAKEADGYFIVTWWRQNQVLASCLEPDSLFELAVF